MTETFDYVIVGAGSAGCVLANKLSENPNTTVALLEAGPKDRDPLIHIPLGIGKMHPERKFDWGYDSEPDPLTNGRVIDAMRGKVLGGSSSINSMAWVRGNPGDYDRWAQKGALGWSYEDVLPYFVNNESWRGPGASKLRGRAGPILVEPTRDRDPLYDAWIKSIEQAGYNYTADYNAEQHEGFSRIQFSIGDGKRCSAAVGFLRPVLSRRNLDVSTDTLATRILLDGAKAIGVECRRGETTRTLKANKEVILCGGTFNSPQLLMLSGIGPGAHLRSHNIDVVADLPGVGANLQDHVCSLVSYERKASSAFLHSMRFDRIALAMVQAHFFGSGPATLLPAGLIGHIKSRPELATPDLQFILRGVLPNIRPWFPVVRPAFQDGFGIRPVLLRPYSRGRIELRSSDPREMVKVYQNFFYDERDIATLREGVRICRRVTTGPALDSFRGDELDPGLSVQSDQDMDAWIRNTIITAHHPTSTCAMGAGSEAVLDPQLRVRGFDGLRVVDASAMPDIPSGNTNAPVMMMAAKAADMILGRRGRSFVPAPGPTADQRLAG